MHGYPFKNSFKKGPSSIKSFASVTTAVAPSYQGNISQCI